MTGSGSSRDAASDGPASSADAGATGADAGCAAAGSASACQACCSATNPEAGLRFFGLALGCACAPMYCGPVDGGAGDAGAGDAAAFGQGSCTAAMCAGQAVPSDACTTCVTATIETAAGPGPCVGSASLACFGDPACAPITQCALACPQ